MDLGDLVATASAVASARARTQKVALLADLFRRAPAGEVAIAVGLVSGEPRQGRIGVGWATLGSIAVEPAAHGALSVADLDAALEAIRDATGPGSVQARARILGDLLSRATAEEADFVRRLLLGDLRQGALEGVVAEAVARAAEVGADLVRRGAMLSGDLPATAAIALGEGEAGLRAIGLEVMRPVQPMLAATAEDVADALATTGEAAVEWKLDGIRIQVHRAGDAVRVFTRNLNDVTERLPEVVALAASLPVARAVLDGEAIVLADAEHPHTLQETLSRVGRGAVEPSVPVGAWFFDVLHLDGDDLIDRPLRERLAALDRVAASHRVPSTVTADADEAAHVLQAALAAGHEGVMVKAIGSVYQAGRRGRAWIKVKRARMFDLVVLAAEWGHGRRRGLLSNLHLGARAPEGGFVMVGKTFKGLTDETLAWQTERLLALETERAGIVVRVRPELVVEIALDGVQASPRYAGGVALRFARVKRYRPDRSPADADTIDAVRALLPPR